MASDTEITKVRIVIRHLLWQIRDVRNDRDAAWKWVNRFANTLQYQDLEQDPDQYALAILAEARSFNDQKKRNGQMKWVREQLAKEGVTSPTQEQLDEKWLEMYGNEESPQDAPNGNAWDERRSGSNSVATVNLVHPAPIAESARCATSEAVKALADASTREGEDERDHRGNTGILESSTSAKTLSEAREGQARESRRTGAPVRGAKSSTAPVRSRASFRNKEEFIQWAIDDGLDPVDAGECWEATEERGGKDADGNTVKNMKAFARQWCRTRANNRRTA